MIFQEQGLLQITEEEKNSHYAFSSQLTSNQHTFIMKLSISVAFFCGSALAATAGYFTQQHYLGRQRLLDNLKHAPPLSSLEELNQEQKEKERIGAFFHQYQRVDDQDEAETLRADEDYDVDEGASQQQLDERKLSRREGFRKVMGNLALPPQYKPFHPQFLESPTPGSIGRPSGHEEQQLVAQRGAAMYELQMTRNYQTTETRTNNKGEKYTHTNHHSTPLCHYKISTPIFIGPDTLNDDALNLVDADNQEARDDQPVQSVQAIQLLDLPKDAFFLPKMQAVVQTTRTSIPKIPSVEDTLRAISESHEATVKDAIVIHRSGPFNSTNGTTSSYSISE